MITDPFHHLAVEDALLDLPGDAPPVLRLWRARPAVVIGKNQIPWREADLGWMQREGVVLCRRVSGGGAVYQDEGNLNWSFCVPRDRYSAGAVTAGKIAAGAIDGFLITGGQFVGNGTNGEWIFKTRSGSYTVGNAGNVQRVEIGTNGSTQGMLGLYTGMQAHGGGEAENAPGALKAWWADDTGSYGYGSIGGVLVTELLSPAGKSSATAGITLMADGYTSFSKATIRASQTDIRGGPLQVVANDIFGGGVLVLSGGKVTLRDIREALYSPNDNYGRLYADTITQVLVGPGGTSGTQPTQGYLAVAFPAASGTANVNAYYANGNDGRYRWFFRAISSSLKAKNLLGDYTVDAEDFMALQPRRFTWKADEHEKVTGGFILEEVADLDTLMPFVNMSPTDPAVPASLDYGGMVAMLTDVVQRLIAKNDLTI